MSTYQAYLGTTPDNINAPNGIPITMPWFSRVPPYWQKHLKLSRVARQAKKGSTERDVFSYPDWDAVMLLAVIYYRYETARSNTSQGEITGRFFPNEKFRITKERLRDLLDLPTTDYVGLVLKRLQNDYQVLFVKSLTNGKYYTGEMEIWLDVPMVRYITEHRPGETIPDYIAERFDAAGRLIPLCKDRGPLL